MRRRSALAVAAVLWAGLVVPASGEASFPGRNGAIAVAASEYDPETEDFPGEWSRFLRAFHPGSGPDLAFAHRVDSLCSVADGECRGASYSPSGREIVTVQHGTAPERDRIMVFSADGSRRTFVGRSESAVYSDATWSPDGRQIVFARETYTGNRTDIYVVGLTGTPLRRLASGWAPAWSTRGLVAFSRKDGLYVMRANGTGARRLRRDPCASHDCRSGKVDWSPDGSRLAYSAGGDIAVMSATGTGRRRLTRSRALDDWAPTWSPDGHKIAFARFAEYYSGAFEPRAILAVPDNGGRVVHLLGQKPTRTLTPHGSGLQIDLGSLDWQALPR
jgi:dipeptidyl aminopeptidase/acylaminoacyl peptidase